MPLTGKAKTDYQRAYMRKHRSNKPALDPVRPKPTRSELQVMIHNIEQKREKAVQPDFIPWYNPELHTTGDKVKMKDGAFVRIVTL